jgi:hypothetical protein
MRAMKRGLFWTLWLVLIVLSTSCKRNGCIEAEGGRFEDVRNFENFHTFILDIPGEIEVWTDTTRSYSRIDILAQKDILENLQTSIASGVVSVGFTNCFESHDEITFRLYVNRLQRIVVNQSGRVKTGNRLIVDHFSLELNQSTTADMVIHTDSIHTSLGNASLCTYHGYTHMASHELLSAGTLSAMELISDTSYVNIIGTGNVNLHAIGLLSVDVNGGGSVSFIGSDTLNIEEKLSNGGRLIDNR